MRRHPGLYIALGFLLSGALLALAVTRLDLPRFVETLRSAVLWPWLPLAIASYLAGHVVRGVRCRRLVSREATLSVVDGTNVVVLGYAVNNILPARLGEFARAGMLAERTGLSYTQTLTLTLLERILDGLVLLVMFAVVLAGGRHGGWMGATFELAATALGVAAVLVLVAVLAPGRLLALTSRWSQRLSTPAHDRAVGIVSSITHGVAYLRRPSAALGVVLLSVLVWSFEAGMFLLLLPALGIPASPRTAVLAMTVTNLGILVPSSPGYIGVFHYLCMMALVSTGVGREVALGYASLVHLAFYVPITAWGVGVLAAYGITLRRTLALSQAAKPETEAARTGAELFSRPAPTPRESPPTPFMWAVTEALLPGEPATLDAAARARVVAGSAAFVQGQVEALPARLRVLLGVGLAGFRAITAATHLRTYCALPLDRRRRWTQAWAYGRVTPARQLFRAIRSTALLSYYESDDVRAHLSAEAGERAGPARGPADVRG